MESQAQGKTGTVHAPPQKNVVRAPTLGYHVDAFFAEEYQQLWANIENEPTKMATPPLEL